MSQKKPLAVVKVGGDILLDDSQRIGLVNNILGLISDNWNVVVLHGGGSQVSAMQSRWRRPGYTEFQFDDGS